MSAPDSDRSENEKRIEELQKQAGNLLVACRFRSAMRLYAELQRLAKTEQRVIPYMNAVFHQMDLAKDMLDPQDSQEKAVELIALLESPERARLLQSDFPERSYEATVAWMTACAYENLADATGMAEGYNSEGMHSCIADGIQVCHRTGKLGCVTCFREYATDVYSSAEDILMALHHSRTIAQQQGGWSDRGDRRWLGARNGFWLLLLVGQLGPAEQALVKARETCEVEGVNLKLLAKTRVDSDWDTLHLIKGDLSKVSNEPRPYPEGEYLVQDMRWALNNALAACCRGEFAAAQEQLMHWDRWLTEHQCLSNWFEVRLRLLAVLRLAGDTKKMEALARQLESKARPAHDWLTLRRLERLRDPNEVPSPLALLSPLSSGPFAAPAVAATVPAAPPTEAPAEPAAPAPSPLEATIQQFIARLQQSGDDANVLAALRADVLAVAPASVSHPLDATRLLHLCQFLAGDGRSAAEIWQWAETVARPFPQEPAILSLLAALGDVLRSTPEANVAELIPTERLEQLFRQALDLNPDHANNFARAGAYFLGQEKLDEAERCLARGFRLDRTSSFLALRLARVYDQTNRPRDALAVLDLCLRHGSNDPDVAWQAALKALQLAQYEPLLIYLDRFEQLRAGQWWVNYYRAIALLELGRPANALPALDEEERRDANRPFPVAVLRACAFAALSQEEPFRQQVEAVLALRLAAIDYLTIQGLLNLLARLWKAVAAWPEDDALRGRLEARLLAAGLMPEEFFAPGRQKGEKVKDVYFYHCRVRQALDANWPQSEGCLPGQAEWTEYLIVWGVLGRDEEEVGRHVLDWQKRCYPLPAEVVECERQSGPYTDRPGVVWQGVRRQEEATT